MKDLTTEPTTTNLLQDFKFMQLLTVNETSKLTTLSRSTIYRMVKRGDFPELKNISQCRSGFLVKDIYEWIQNR